MTKHGAGRVIARALHAARTRCLIFSPDPVLPQSISKLLAVQASQIETAASTFNAQPANANRILVLTDHSHLAAYEKAIEFGSERARLLLLLGLPEIPVPSQKQVAIYNSPLCSGVVFTRLSEGFSHTIIGNRVGIRKEPVTHAVFASTLHEVLARVYIDERISSRTLLDLLRAEVAANEKISLL